MEDDLFLLVINLNFLGMHDVQGGPFFNTNRQFDEALEDRIFDCEMEGMLLKAEDQNGDTGRDLLASILVELLSRPEGANKMFSVVSVLSPFASACASVEVMV